MRRKFKRKAKTEQFVNANVSPVLCVAGLQKLYFNF